MHGVGARLEIQPEQAKTVRRIFKLYAEGNSTRTIAKLGNNEHVASPQPRGGRQQSWAPSSVRVILRNERYIGLSIWGKTHKLRNPTTGRRIQRQNPRSSWISTQAPELRIVSDSLWGRAVERFAVVERTYGGNGRKGGLTNRGASSRYIFSGLLRCGLCGGNIVIVSGGGRNHARAEYGCAAAHLRDTCTNKRRVAFDALEKELFTKLQNDVLSQPAIDYVLARLGDEIEASFAQIDADLVQMRRRKTLLEAELSNLSRTIASGFDSPTLRAAIAEREKEIAGLVGKVSSRSRTSVRSQVRDLRRFVENSMSDLRQLLTGEHANVAATRMALAKHVDKIVLLPDGERDIQYRGSWKLLGNSGGAEGQSCSNGSFQRP
jgi:site-specific DNA recombinase